MKSALPAHYTEAIAFALHRSSETFREFYSERIYLHVQQPRPDRRDLTGRIYLEAYEKVPGGIVFLNWWAQNIYYNICYLTL